MSESATTSETCPRCGNPAKSLLRVETGMRLRLQEQGINDVPEAICNNCMAAINGQVSAGATLRREMELKEQHRTNLYKNRMTLVKQGKTLVAQKQFSEAAIVYEKYLRILEMVYEKEAGGLSPDMFSSPGKQQEMTIIAGVYWDLLNIYDTSNRYGDRQAKVALKLADFARFTPLFASIVRQSEKKAKKSKNPEAYKLFLNESNAKRPRCFVATAAFQSVPTQTVQILCAFRDQRLLHHRAGQWLVNVYEFISPVFANWLDRNPSMKPLVRRFLNMIAAGVEKLLESRSDLRDADLTNHGTIEINKNKI